MSKVDCKKCRHFRSAPYEAKKEGCYFPANMPQKQTDAFLDEQQIPGDHRAINRRGDCPDFQAEESSRGFLDWLFSESA